MENQATSKSHLMLFFNTLAFTICFAAWMLNGVLVTFLIENQVFDWGPIEIGWLMGIPVLTGSIFRLPAGMLTDKFGGKPVYGSLLFLCAIPMYLLSHANSFLSFARCSFGFGLAGVSFYIGIAFTSVWYTKDRQGTALGNSFTQLIISRLLLSVIGAGFVIGIRMTGQWFPPKHIGRAEGFYAGWGNFGSAWAAMTLPWIAIMMH